MTPADTSEVADGGWGGIRTHGTLTRTAVFKTAAFNRSATHPCWIMLLYQGFAVNLRDLLCPFSARCFLCALYLCPFGTNCTCPSEFLEVFRQMIKIALGRLYG
jgi:hypothetical protein